MATHYSKLKEAASGLGAVSTLVLTAITLKLLIDDANPCKELYASLWLMLAATGFAYLANVTLLCTNDNDLPLQKMKCAGKCCANSNAICFLYIVSMIVSAACVLIGLVLAALAVPSPGGSVRCHRLVPHNSSVTNIVNGTFGA